jgi:RimJ/RimL family protein N-acetyltransferase
VAALVAELAGRPGVRRIEAWVDLDNAASRRVLERAGFAVCAVSGPQVAYLRLV